VAWGLPSTLRLVASSGEVASGLLDPPHVCARAAPEFFFGGQFIAPLMAEFRLAPTFSFVSLASHPPLPRVPFTSLEKNSLYLRRNAGAWRNSFS